MEAGEQENWGTESGVEGSWETGENPPSKQGGSYLVAVS
jgi:hypothetical protein